MSRVLFDSTVFFSSVLFFPRRLGFSSFLSSAFNPNVTCCFFLSPSVRVPQRGRRALVLQKRFFLSIPFLLKTLLRSSPQSPPLPLLYFSSSPQSGYSVCIVLNKSPHGEPPQLRYSLHTQRIDPPALSAPYGFDSSVYVLNPPQSQPLSPSGSFPPDLRV